MILIVDTSMLIAALLKDSPVRRILLHPFFRFYTPDFTLDEIKKNIDYLKKRTKLEENELQILINIIFKSINVVPLENYKNKWKEAEKIIGKIDKEDIPFIALALSIQNDGIWSNDPDFLKQKKIRIWRTKELLEYL